MRRYEYIDSLRGLAALGVIYFHTADFALKHNIVASPLEHAIFLFFTEWADLGKIAVSVFFAISGFVIPFSILKPQSRPLAAFTISRFLRLYPAYWLSIPFGIVFFYILLDRNFSSGLVLTNMTMLQQFLGIENIIGVYWTLQIELIFYGISALLFVLGILAQPCCILLISVFFLACAIGLGALRFVLEIRFPVALPLALCLMFWGLAWRYYLFEQETSTFKRFFWLTTAVIMVGVPVISLLAYSIDMGFGETWYRYTISYYISIVIFILFTSNILIRNNICVYIGKISYSMYLFGPIGQEIAVYLFRDILTAVPIHLLILTAVAITFCIAAAVYKYVEKPSIALARRLIHMLDLKYSKAQ